MDGRGVHLRRNTMVSMTVSATSVPMSKQKIHFHCLAESDADQQEGRETA